MITMLKRQWRLAVHRRQWRQRNPHNRTVAGSLFDPRRVSVGNFSYGALNVVDSYYDNERLEIGHLCSIARDVHFFLAGHHFMDRPTMFPVCGAVSGTRGGDGYSRGPIVVGSDVWIGIGAMILSGVTIGQGAVIGAGSVVARDVPPYAIVAGNRAQILKYRFSDDLIAELLKLDFSRFTQEFFIRHLDLLTRRPCDPQCIRDLARELGQGS